MKSLLRFFIWTLDRIFELNTGEFSREHLYAIIRFFFFDSSRSWMLLSLLHISLLPELRIAIWKGCEIRNKGGWEYAKKSTRVKPISQRNVAWSTGKSRH